MTDNQGRVNGNLTVDLVDVSLYFGLCQQLIIDVGDIAGINRLHTDRDTHRETSNVTSRHRGPKRKLWAGYGVSSLKQMSCPKCTHYNGCHMLRCVFIAHCGIVHFLCTVHVFEVRASSPRLLLCQILCHLQPPLLS